MTWAPAHRGGRVPRKMKKRLDTQAERVWWCWLKRFSRLKCALEKLESTGVVVMVHR